MYNNNNNNTQKSENPYVWDWKKSFSS